MENKIIKHLITTFVNKKFRNPEHQRKFLIDCIQSSGYIQEGYTPNEDYSEEEYSDLYEHIMPNTQENVSVSSYPDFQTSIMEVSQSSVDPYGFNRTFIHATDHHSNKLAELQKRGITYEESQFNKVKEKMENILRNKEDSDKILQTALNIYLNILVYYSSNPFNFTENKGSLKRGYIFLCVYYSLVYNNRPVDRERLMDDAGTIRLKDLPVAEKNIKMIFNGVRGYEFITSDKMVTNFNPNNFLSNTLNINSRDLLNTIRKVIEEEDIPSTTLGIYSVVYFVCNNYYPFKVKINYHNLETSVTYSLLNQVFQPFASATVRKITDRLRSKFKK